MRNYPINFVVKHPNRFVFLRTARPEAVRNLQARSEDLTLCFQIGVTFDSCKLQSNKHGGDLETAE